MARTKRAELQDDKNEDVFEKNDWVEEVDITTEIKSVQDAARSDTEKEADEDARTDIDKTPAPTSEVEPYDAGFTSTKHITAKVFSKSAKALVGSRVLLRNAKTKQVDRGRVKAAGETEFAVEWDDKSVTVEHPKNYSRIINRNL